MEFAEPLEAFLSQTVGEEYYSKSVTVKHQYHGLRKGILTCIGSDGSVTFSFNREKDGREYPPIYVDYNIKGITDIELIDEASEYKDKDDKKDDVVIKQPGISIKTKIFDIAKFKTAQHMLYSCTLNNTVLSADNRRKYLDEKVEKTDIKERIKIGEEILKSPVFDAKSKDPLSYWSRNNQHKQTYEKLKYQYNEDELISILNAYRDLWINYVKKNNEKLAKEQDKDKDGDSKMNDGEKKEEQKTFSSYKQWDTWVIEGTAPKPLKPATVKANDIYVKSLWPHIFQGPYFRKNDKGERIEYYKCKRTVFTLEVSAEKIAKAQKEDARKDRERKARQKMKRMEVRRGIRRGPPRGRYIDIDRYRQRPRLDLSHLQIPINSGRPRPKTKIRKPASSAASSNRAQSISSAAPSSSSAPAEGRQMNTKMPMARPRVRLTREMKTETDVKSALCIIPPKNLWEKIQAIRMIHDPAYKRWMPHINIFFPFINEKYFTEIAQYIQEEIIDKNNIQKFNISLNKFDVFDRIRGSLSGSMSTKNETMFLNPSGCNDNMQEIFNALKGDWQICANKHGGGFSPHLTVGKFQMKDMEKYMKDFQRNWTKITWQCENIYLISRRGNDPFVIRHTLTLKDIYY